MNKKIYLPLIIAALVVLVVWSAYGQGTKSSAVRQNWEYKVCTLYRSIEADSTGWSARSEDGQSMGAPFSMNQRSKELGEQGWELISVTAISSASHDGYQGYNNEGTLFKTTPSWAGYTTGLHYWFKRPK